MKKEKKSQEKNAYFWCVYALGKTGPIWRHSKEADAIEEANRICKKEGVKTYVLRAVCEFSPSEPIMSHAMFPPILAECSDAF